MFVLNTIGYVPILPCTPALPLMLVITNYGSLWQIMAH
jgi:hypothetical protein